MARRYLALWFPFLPTDRLRRKHPPAAGARPDERPLVVVERRRGALCLTAVDRPAAKLGLAPGLMLADARARLPDIAVAEADPDADERFVHRLAALCERFTPLVALDPPHGLALDITGCAHLFGGEAALCRQLDRRLRGVGLGVRIGLAETPAAARAFGRFCHRQAVDGAPMPADGEAMARALPIDALEMPAETTLALARAGLRTLGDLAGRPSTALAARFGEGLIARLEQVLGRQDRRITPLRPPAECMVERHFPEPLLQAEALEAVLARLLAEAARVLEGRGAGGRLFEASFFRSDGAVKRVRVETGRPSRDPAAILRLFRERLDTLADPVDPGFGFDAVRLAVPSCEPFMLAQPDLEGRGGVDEGFADLVDRLSVRFGRERVLGFLPRDSHHPERESGLRPAGAGAASAGRPPATPWPLPEPAEPPLRPVLMFDPPQPIETLAEIPDGPPLRFRWRRVLHDIARAEGPERIAPEWWRDGPDEPTRDYFRIEDAAGRRYWVFRQGLYLHEAGEPRWFLHGVFA